MMSASASRLPPALAQRVPLQDLAVAPASLRMYSTARNKFLTHTRLSHSHLLHLPATRVDRLLCDYFQASFDAGGSYSYTSHALHGVIFFNPALKLCLPRARQALKGWDRVRRRTSHPPLTWELCVLLACSFARSGLHAAAIVMLVGFDCYMRINELLSLRRSDVVLPRDPRMGRAHVGMMVVLRATKTGPNQSVSLQSEDVAQLLHLWMQLLPDTAPDAPVFPGCTAQAMNSYIHSACASLGLSATPYVCHSMRHGGATADYLRTKSIEHVVFRGRWASLKSAKTYVQQARALLAARAMPQALADAGTVLADNIVPVMSELLLASPPTVPRLLRRPLGVRRFSRGGSSVVSPASSSVPPQCHFVRGGMSPTASAAPPAAVL